MEVYNQMMKKMVVLLSAVMLAGVLRPAMRHDCGQAMSACAPRPVASACHKAGTPACHKNAAPAKRECPGMACCIVRDARAAVAALSVAPPLSEEGVLSSALPSIVVPLVAGFASSPSPPGHISSQIGFLASSSLRGPPALA